MSCRMEKFGHAAGNHEEAQEVFVAEVGRVVAEDLFQHREGEGTEGELGGGTCRRGMPAPG